ncbi:MAG: hypothetical protein U7123_08495 [Potamolinea sp.]
MQNIHPKTLQNMDVSEIELKIYQRQHDEIKHLMCMYGFDSILGGVYPLSVQGRINGYQVTVLGRTKALPREAPFVLITNRQLEIKERRGWSSVGELAELFSELSE